MARKTPIFLLLSFVLVTSTGIGPLVQTATTLACNPSAGRSFRQEFPFMPVGLGDGDGPVGFGFCVKNSSKKWIGSLLIVVHEI